MYLSLSKTLFRNNSGSLNRDDHSMDCTFRTVLHFMRVRVGRRLSFIRMGQSSLIMSYSGLFDS